ncbi:hypothetical protein ACHWQZ_G017041 [Mnemiopsis leidyi]
MDFSVDLLNTMEKKMTSEIQKVVKAVNASCASEVTESALMKLNKNPLAQIVTSLLGLIEQNVELCKCAAGKMDQLKSDKIADQKLLIELQQTQMNSVQETVKSEMKSWADVVKKNSNVNQRNVKQLTENSVKQAVRAVNEEERRSKNLMIYGWQEKEKEADFEVIKAAKEVFDEVDIYPLPHILEAYRIGKKEQGMTDDKMKKIDDQLKKTKADTKRLAGRPRNKVLRSPQKSLTGSSSDDYCPCKKYMEVRNILSKSVCSKEDVEGVVKSYAAVARESQKEVIQQAALAQSSKKVVESVVRQMDADKVEREKRRSNVVVLSAPEPEKEASAEQKKKEDKNFCSNVLGIPLKDVETCWRAGKIDVSKPDYLRPLVIKLKSEGLVEEWTKDGKGYKTESGFWINKDLCAADRKANFLAREQRRTRLQKT